jgi:2-isopropylmalate synthase
MDRVYIFDTTLRDGEQAPGFSMTPEEKVKFARALEKLGVDVIEAGFPISSYGDFEAVREVSKEVRAPTIAGLARCEEADIERAAEALSEAKRKRIHVFIATSPIHMKHKLQLPQEEVLKKAVKAVKLAKKYTDDVEFSAEDATRSELEFLCRIYKETAKAGATTLNIPDTVGYTTPYEFYELITRIKEAVKDINPIISIHCHDDLGLATSNTIAAIRAGARQVECTVNGIGERAGNTSMEEVVMILKTRKDIFGLDINVNTKEIYPTSRLLVRITGIAVPPNKAVVGANAFAHEAGIHQDGVLKERTTYEIMKPQDVGVPSSELVLGKHSGRHALYVRLEELGYSLSPDELQKVFTRFKVLADKKKVIYDEDLDAIVADEVLKRRGIEEKYKLISANFSAGTDMTPAATAIIEISGDAGKEVKRATAFGNGPVDAVYNAIGKAVELELNLVSFSVSAITGGTDAQGHVSVCIEKDGVTATGTGTHTDIVIAAAKALVTALNRLERSKNRGKLKGV